nr:hypothetical protein [Azospirillum brasilense]
MLVRGGDIGSQRRERLAGHVQPLVEQFFLPDDLLGQTAHARRVRFGDHGVEQPPGLVERRGAAGEPQARLGLAVDQVGVALIEASHPDQPVGAQRNRKHGHQADHQKHLVDDPEVLKPHLFPRCTGLRATYSGMRPD